MNRQVVPEALQVVGSPPCTYQDRAVAVDVQIRIRPEETYYTAEINALGAGRCVPVPIEMSRDDLKSLNRHLQEAMRVVVNECAVEEELTPEKSRTQLYQLAEWGNYGFKKVFKHHDALATIKRLLPLLELEAQILKRTLSIQITTENFFLPWELIYPASLIEEPVSYKHFWGMKHLISRVIVQETQPGDFVSPIIRVIRRPRLGLLAYCGLPSVVADEIPFFEKLNSDGKITLFKLRDLKPEKKKEDEFKEFKNFWDNAFNLAHFACDARYENGAPELSRILLSDEFPISLRDMEIYFVDGEGRPLVIEGHPLIMMNACETGNMNPLYTSHFAAAFLRHGARGVVATECAVPDVFATNFAKQLYKHLLNGEPLGESLLITRKYFLEKYHNPSGLLYSMYAPPSIRLAQR
jgi:hypothetical protein